MFPALVAFSILLAAGNAQSVGDWIPENHPKLDWKKCTDKGSCETVNAELTLDANWRWVHEAKNNSYQNCIYTGSEVQWNMTLCPDGDTCAKNCALDGAEYEEVYGATTNGDSLTMKYVTRQNFATNIGSRLFLMNGVDKYQKFSLLGNEFAFDVDLSQVSCGLNAALYFVSMDEDGGASRYPSNKAGAKYGTGYCDANCPRDLKFVNGKANLEGWKQVANDYNSGLGYMGSCCPQMSIWDSNSISTSFAAHPCKRTDQEACQTTTCSGKYSDSSERFLGECDADGCDFNPYRQGDLEFYGPGKIVDTSKKFTVITQFLNGTDGSLSSIKRFYQQGGILISNPESSSGGVKGSEINSTYCSSQKVAFEDTDYFSLQGGMLRMGDALSKSMVLVTSIWHDYYSNMLWLDSTFPPEKDPRQPGVARGTCGASTGDPEDVINNQQRSTVVFSNIRYGSLNSTFNV